MSMNTGDSIRRGVMWLFVGNTGAQIIGFLFGIILARILAPEDFGMLLTIQVFTGLVGFVAGGGMGQALVRAKDATVRDYHVVFTLQLVIGMVIYLLFYISAPTFAQWYERPLYEDLLRVSALSFLLRPFVNLPSNILHREMRFKERSLVGVLNLLISNTVAITMGMMGYGVWSLTVSGLAASFISIFVLCKLAAWAPRIDGDWRRARELANYGLLVSANDIVYYLRQQTTIFILSRAATASAVGLYNKADSLVMLPKRFVAGSVYEVLFRALARARDDLDLSRYLYFRSITLVAAYAFPLFIGLGFLAEPFVVTLYGEKWRAAAAPISVLVLASPFMILENLAGAVLAARDQLARELIAQIIVVLITAGAVTLSLDLGLVGVAMSVAIATIYASLHLHWLASKSLGTPMMAALKAFRAPLLLNAPMAAGLALMNWLLPPALDRAGLSYLVTMTVCGAALYASVFFFAPITALEPEVKRWKKYCLTIRNKVIGA